MRSLLLQLLGVACFFGIVFTTGNRPENFTSFSKPSKEKVSTALPFINEEKQKSIIPNEILEVVCVDDPIKPFPNLEQLPILLYLGNPKPNIFDEIALPKPKRELIAKTETFPLKVNHFRIATETSLREFPAQEADALKRIGEGEWVEILENTEKYWWKVNYAGKIGWVKRHLLIPVSKPNANAIG